MFYAVPALQLNSSLFLAGPGPGPGPGAGARPSCPGPGAPWAPGDRPAAFLAWPGRAKHGRTGPRQGRIGPRHCIVLKILASLLYFPILFCTVLGFRYLGFR